ncbi:MAG: hypothetical protein ACR2HR_05505 [Euzebya sp.]
MTPHLGGRYVVRITPADVGRRVSIRARTGEDSGGPRFTDTLGVLLSWDEGTLRVRRRDDRVVEVAEVNMVAGKLLPPAPPPRRGRSQPE